MRASQMAFFVVVLLLNLTNLTLAQPPRQVKVNRKAAITEPVTDNRSILAESGKIKRLNPAATTFKNDIVQLNQGGYSVVQLKLPGSSKASDYYVKRLGNQLILNGDIVVYDYSVQSTMSYTKDDETHTFGKDDLYRWPNATVPVVLDNSVENTQGETVEEQGETSEKSDLIVTTEDELQGFYIVKALAYGLVDSSRITWRDKQSYFSVLLDDNNRKPICRLHFNNSNNKKIGLFDHGAGDKQEEKVLIESIDEIYKHGDRLKSTMAHYLEKLG